MIFINGSMAGRPTTMFQVLPNNKILSFRIHRACKSSVPGHVKASNSCMHKNAKQIQGMHTYTCRAKSRLICLLQFYLHEAYKKRNAK